MNNLEKLLFFEITNKQFGNQAENYLETYKSLSALEKERFSELSDEVHHLWNTINGKTHSISGGKEINSVDDYLTIG